jgi:LacI family transcriptional regulator
MKSKRKLRILLLMGRHTPWDDALFGITTYAAQHTRWVLDVASPITAVVNSTLRERKWDGVIGHMNSWETYRGISAWAGPAVNCSGDLPAGEMPDMAHTTTDNEGLGRLVARYFIDRGFHSFAFLGSGNYHNSMQRERGFIDELAQAGLECSVLRLEEPPEFGPLPLSTADLEILDWMKGLPQPTALLAFNDLFAFRASQVCYEADIPVPEHLAIMGAHNDKLICHLSHPSLSSVAFLGQREGWEAARLLDGLLKRQISPGTTVELPISHIVTRHSTDLLAIDDSALAKALKLIANHASEGIGVADVARHAGMNRRALERHFQTLLGRSPGMEIQRVRIERVKQLLVGGNKPMGAIADACGFCDARWMSVVFRKAEGTTPSEYRRQYGLQGK